MNVTGQPASLRAGALSKSFGGTPALSGVDITIDTGEVRALIGENGSGKSTLIKILSGYHRPDAGQVYIAGKPMHLGSSESSHRLGCRVVHQDLGLVDDCSVLDNLALGNGFPTRWATIRSKTARQTAERSLAQVGLDLDVHRMVGDLAASQKTGVALARALRSDPHVPVHLLVLDEPTATLPHDQVDHLLAMVREVAAQGVGVLYVSHRLDEIRAIADTVTVLRDGKRVASDRASLLPHDRLVQLLTNGKLDTLAAPSRSRPEHTDKTVLQVTGLAAGPLRQLSFDAPAGSVIGIAGLTGSGRESALISIFGGITRRRGSVMVNGQELRPGRPDLSIAAGVAYVPPDRKNQGAVMSLSAQSNLTLPNLRPFWNRLWLRKRTERAEAQRWFGTLAIRPAGKAGASFSSFSGGNQQKILLAKWLRCGPSVLLLDEPTQGVDIASKAELHRQIVDVARRGASVVISSADLDELVALSTSVLVVRDGLLAARLDGPQVTVSNILLQTIGGESVA